MDFVVYVVGDDECDFVYMWMLMLLQVFVDVLATEGLQNLIKATRSK